MGKAERIRRDMGMERQCAVTTGNRTSENGTVAKTALLRLTTGMHRAFAPAFLASATLLVLLAVFAVPDNAFAAGSGDVGFGAMVTMLQTLVTVLLLPLGILIAAWKIVYLAVFVGIMNIDPFDLGTSDPVTVQIKNQFWGFAKGLAWVAGIWVVLQLALTVANMLASALDANF